MITIPSYDYRCSDCDAILEFKHPMSETMEWHDCPNELCLGFLHKVFSPAAVSFKGSGWGKVYGDFKPKGEK